MKLKNYFRSKSKSRRTTRILGLSTVLTIVATLRPRTNDLFDNGVERATVLALDSQKVPLSVVALGFAVVAHNIHYPLQVTGHWMFGNISSSGLPCCRHGLLRDNGLFANGTAIIKASQLAKTVSMYSVTAGQILGRLARGKHIFSADRTIVFVFILETTMCFKHIDGNAHTTFGAMSKIFSASNSAKATLFAMEGFFGLTHP